LRLWCKKLDLFDLSGQASGKRQAASGKRQAASGKREIHE
jgi:hypothetical protein